MATRDGTYDAVVIGAGAGGMTVAIGLAGFKRRVALVEAGRVGGDCTNTGCIPSKRLIHLSRRPVGRPVAELLDDVRRMRNELAQREEHELEEAPLIDLVRGAARFSSASTVEVTGPDGPLSLRAANIVIATGSRPAEFEIPGLPAERRLTNEELFELTDAPTRLVIVGAGAIGLEMAAAFTRLGTSVTIVDIADRVLPGGQPAASQAVARAYAAAGIDVRLNARVSSFDERTRTLAFATEAGAETVADVDAVLVATGRVANVEALQLDVAGLTADRDGIAVDSWGRTSVPGIWAVGDVTRGSHQTHAANALGRRIVRRLAFRWLPAFVRPQVIPSAVFSDPEVAWVGPTPTELRRRYHPDLLRHVRVELADTDRGLTDGVGGFVEITATRLTGRIVAATCVGPSASELIGMLTLAMSRRVSMYKLSRLVFAYPTFAAAIGKAADEFAFATIGGMRAELFAYAKHRFARPAWKIPV